MASNAKLGWECVHFTGAAGVLSDELGGIEMKIGSMSACVAGAALFGILSVAATALAASWGSYGKITHLETTDSGYRVYTTSTSNPNGCSAADYVEPHSSNQPAEIDLINKTLLAAMLAGKEVRFYLSTNDCGSTGRPAYAAVRVRN